MSEIRTYSSAYQRFFTAMLLDEGPESNDPRDPGGRTKFGFSQRAYPKLNFDTFTVEEARELAYQDYWARIYGDSLPEPIAGVMFDAAFNMGITAAVRLAQRAVKVSDDGAMGPETRHAIENTNIARFIERYTSLRILQYTQMKNFDLYGLGWIARAVRTAIRVAR